MSNLTFYPLLRPGIWFFDPSGASGQSGSGLTGFRCSISRRSGLMSDSTKFSGGSGLPANRRSMASCPRGSGHLKTGLVTIAQMKCPLKWYYYVNVPPGLQSSREIYELDPVRMVTVLGDRPPNKIRPCITKDAGHMAN